MSESFSIDESTRNLILREYPFPVAAAFKRAIEERDDNCRDGSLPIVLRYVTLILFADYQRSAERDPYVENKLYELLISRAVEGKWFGLLNALLGAFAKGSRRPFVPELVSSFYGAGGHRRSWQLLQHFTGLRNKVHKTPLTPKELKRLGYRFVPLLVEFLLEQQWMRDYELLLVDHQENPLAVLRGANPTVQGESWLRLRSPSGGYLPLEPLIKLAPSPECMKLYGQTYAHEVFVFDGLPKDKKAVEFRSPYDNHEDDEPKVWEWWRAIRSLSGDKKLSIDPIELKRRADEITRKSRQDYIDSGKYLEDAFVERESWNDRLTAFLRDSKPGVLISAPTGAGKSSVLCHTARVLQDAGYIVLFWSHQRLPHANVKKSLTEALSGVAGDELTVLLDFIRVHVGSPLGGGCKLVVLLDSINERDDREKVLADALELIKTIAEHGDSTKVILSLRDTMVRDQRELLTGHRSYFFTVSEERAGVSVDSMVVTLEPFSDHELAKVFERYKQRFGFHTALQALPDETRELLRRPLVLRLAAQTYEGRELDRRFTIEDIFSDYIDKRTRGCGDQRSSRDLQSVLEEAAAWMYEGETSKLSVALFVAGLKTQRDSGDVRGFYDRLLEEGFFMETPGRLFCFTFDGCFEYLLGSSVIAARVAENETRKQSLEEVGRKAARLPAVTGGLEVFLRLHLSQNPETGAELAAEIVRHAGRAGILAVGGVLGDYEAAGLGRPADVIYAEIARLPLELQVQVLGVVMERAFDTGVAQRLADLAQRRIRALDELGDRRLVAGDLVWLGDVYYNRGDDYDAAAGVLRRAIETLASLQQTPDVADQLHFAKYFFARVLSDSGERQEVEELAEACRAYFEQADTLTAVRGRGLAHFLLYMVRGDAAGFFAKALPHLEAARDAARVLDDRRMLGRIDVNRAIAQLFTASPEEALGTAEGSVLSCEEAGDLQGQAYAHLCLAAICIQSASRTTSSSPAAMLDRAGQALEKTLSLYEITRESYLLDMCRANEAMLDLLQGNLAGAAERLDHVVAAARKADDFFNRHDAEVMLAGAIHRDAARLEALLFEAEEHGYDQGELHALWQLHRLARDSGDDNGAEARKQQANEVAQRLGWGTDPRDSLEMGFYAGIFI